MFELRQRYKTVMLDCIEVCVWLIPMPVLARFIALWCDCLTSALIRAFKAIFWSDLFDVVWMGMCFGCLGVLDGVKYGCGRSRCWRLNFGWLGFVGGSFRQSGGSFAWSAVNLLWWNALHLLHRAICATDLFGNVDYIDFGTTFVCAFESVYIFNLFTLA